MSPRHHPPPVPRPARRTEATEPLRVGYVGGIYPSKGVHVLCEAFAKLAERGVAAKLSVHGVLDWFPDYVAELRNVSHHPLLDTFVGCAKIRKSVIGLFLAAPRFYLIFMPRIDAKISMAKMP